MDEMEPARLELWVFRPNGERYVVLSNEMGVQNAAGPLSNAQIAAIQQDESAIAWDTGRRLAGWVQAHRDEFYVAWPPSG